MFLLPVSPIEMGVAPVYVIPNEGSVSSPPVNPEELGVESVYIPVNEVWPL